MRVSTSCTRTEPSSSLPRAQTRTAPARRVSTSMPRETSTSQTTLSRCTTSRSSRLRPARRSCCARSPVISIPLIGSGRRRHDLFLRPAGVLWWSTHALSGDVCGNARVVDGETNQHDQLAQYRSVRKQSRGPGRPTRQSFVRCRCGGSGGSVRTGAVRGASARDLPGPLTLSLVSETDWGSGKPPDRKKPAASSSTGAGFPTWWR